MFYWSVLLFVAALVSGIFAFLGSQIASILLITFTGLCLWTIWRARQARAPRNQGPDS